MASRLGLEPRIAGLEDLCIILCANGTWPARFDFHKQESYSYTWCEHSIIQRNVNLRTKQAYYLHPFPGELLNITAILADYWGAM